MDFSKKMRNVTYLLTNSTTVLVLLILASFQVVVSSPMAANIDQTPTTTATTANADHHGGVVHLVGDIEPWGWMGIEHFNHRQPGWTPVKYQTWADSKTFRVGDILHFVYPNGDSVLQVLQSDYETCSLASPLTKYTTQDDYVTLNNQGEYYFISGGNGHCRWAQQKFHIKVLPREIHDGPSSEPAVDLMPTAPSPASLEAAAPAPDSRTSSSRNVIGGSWIILAFAILVMFCS